jgi:hypothetical protein
VALLVVVLAFVPGAPAASTVGARPVAFRNCNTDAYTYGAGTNGYIGSVVLDAPVLYRSGPVCSLVESVVVRLTDARGDLLKVKGNPAHVRVIALVGPTRVRQFRGVLLGWRNWCLKRPTAFAYTVTSRTKTVAFHWRLSRPACIDASAPSILRHLTQGG